MFSAVPRAGGRQSWAGLFCQEPRLWRASGVPDAQRSLPPLPGRLGAGGLAFSLPKPAVLALGSPRARGPRTSEAWSCPRVAVGALGWGMSLYPPPSARRGQRVVMEAWGTQLSGAWRHRGCGRAATLWLENPLGFHPEN